MASRIVGLLFVLVCLVAVVRQIVRTERRRAQYARYCPKCGRGLTQQMDAPVCSYCGERLP